VKTERALVDTGPLVAILRESDSHHRACSEALKRIRRPAPTCWPVLTEAAWILRKDRNAVKGLLRFFEQGVFQVLTIEPRAIESISAFFERFSDHEPQLADAALVYLAEREGIDSVFTLDARDFSIYRTPSGKALRILPDPAPPLRHKDR
jgi:hypothetical protein